MDKVKWLGIISLFFAALIFGYQLISSVMTTAARFTNITLVSAFGIDKFDWVGTLPAQFLQDGGHYIIHMPLYLLLIVVGVVLLVISGIFGMK